MNGSNNPTFLKTSADVKKQVPAAYPICSIESCSLESIIPKSRENPKPNK